MKRFFSQLGELLALSGTAIWAGHGLSTLPVGARGETILRALPYVLAVPATVALLYLMLRVSAQSAVVESLQDRVVELNVRVTSLRVRQVQLANDLFQLAAVTTHYERALAALNPNPALQVSIGELWAQGQKLPAVFSYRAATQIIYPFEEIDLLLSGQEEAAKARLYEKAIRVTQ